MTTESTVLEILRHPFNYDGWTVQGLGMMRLYLDPMQETRLHIWDPAQAEDEVSTIHDHPWDFDSTIIFGSLANQRYVLGDANGDGQFELYSSKLVCGVGGGLIGDVFRVGVTMPETEHYAAGESYHQDAPEFHESIPAPGTVTIIRRKFHADRDVAQVCWASGNWVSAEPRPATQDEIVHFTGLALSQHDASS